MSDACDFSDVSVSTANEDMPFELVGMDDLLTAQSIENFTLPDFKKTSSRFFVGVSTEEDGNVTPIIDLDNVNRLCFPLRHINLWITMDIKDPLIFFINAETNDSIGWSILAQVRFRVGGENDDEMTVVDADVFRLGTFSHPISIRIGDPQISRLAVELRYIYRARLFDFEIVPTYCSMNSLMNFDVEGDNTITLAVSGHKFYPDKEIMSKHNLEEFGRGNCGEYFPQMTVELRKELARTDTRPEEIIHALLCFLHPPHQSVQRKHIRPLVIFAYVHRMEYLLHCMENAVIMEPPTTGGLLLEHFHFGERWHLYNLIRTSLLRVEGIYSEAAKAMVKLSDYAALLNLELRQVIEERMHHGWAIERRNLENRTPTKNLNRIVYMKDGGPIRLDENDLHTFAEIKSSYAFGSY